MHKRTLTALLFLSLLCALPAAATADSGGPNLFGYAWSDDLPFDWTDTAAGATLSLSDDNSVGPLELGFSFFFYGQEKTQLYVGSNGLLGLGGYSGISNSTSQCPLTSSAPNDAVMIYWDDLNPNAGGEVRYLTGGTAPYRFAAVEYDSVPHYNSTSTVRIQAVLEETANYIELRFWDVSWERGQRGATGIKNGDGADNLLVDCHTFGYLANEMMVWIGLQGPHDLLAGPGQGAISLSWTDDFDDEEGTRIDRADGLVGPYEQVGLADAGQTTYDDTSAVECNSYWYRVRNHFGETFYSAPSNTASYEFPPYAPSALSAKPDSADAIVLAWTDRSDCETGFVVERTVEYPIDWLELAQVGPDVETYADDSVVPGTPYRYRVMAVAGDLCSAYSDEATLTALLETPLDLFAEPYTESKIDLYWEDSSSAEDGFAIERQDEEGSPFVQIATVGKNVTTFRDFDLEPDSAYTYRVRAYSLLTFSEYSNEATGATFPEDGLDDDDQSEDDVDDDDSGDDDSDDESGCCG